jgi:hypothetical protein
VSAILKPPFKFEPEERASGELRKEADDMAEGKEKLFEQPQLERFVVATPRTRITGSAASQTVKAATERLVQICVVAAGVLRVAILVGLTHGHF